MGSVVGTGIGAGEGIGAGSVGSRSDGVTTEVAWVKAGSLPPPYLLASLYEGEAVCVYPNFRVLNSGNEFPGLIRHRVPITMEVGPYFFHRWGPGQMGQL